MKTSSRKARRVTGLAARPRTSSAPIVTAEYMAVLIPLLVAASEPGSKARVLKHLPRSYFFQNQGHYQLHFNRRGHLRSATLRLNPRLVHLSHDGESFRQPIQTGHVWALKGTRGSNSLGA